MFVNDRAMAPSAPVTGACTAVFAAPDFPR
jgi:hypothetical protein